MKGTSELPSKKWSTSMVSHQVGNGITEQSNIRLQVIFRVALRMMSYGMFLIYDSSCPDQTPRVCVAIRALTHIIQSAHIVPRISHVGIELQCTREHAQRLPVLPEGIVEHSQRAPHLHNHSHRAAVLVVVVEPQKQ